MKHVSIRNLRMDDALIEAMIHNHPMCWLQRRPTPVCSSHETTPERGRLLAPRANEK